MFHLLTSSTILALASSVDIDSIRQDIAAYGRKLFASSTTGSNARSPHGRKLFMATYDCTWSWADNTCKPSSTLIASSFGKAGEAISSQTDTCGRLSSEDVCKAPCKWNKSECELGTEYIMDTLFNLNFDSCGEIGKHWTKQFACSTTYSKSAQCPTDTCVSKSDYSYNADTKKCEQESKCGANAKQPDDKTVVTDDEKCQYMKSLFDCSAISDTTQCSATDAKCVKEEDCKDDGSTMAKCSYSSGVLDFGAFVKPEFQSSWDAFVAKASKCDTMYAHSSCEGSETISDNGAFQVGISAGIVAIFAVLMF